MLSKYHGSCIKAPEDLLSWSDTNFGVNSWAGVDACHSSTCHINAGITNQISSDGAVHQVIWYFITMTDVKLLHWQVSTLATL